jgi:hypothetical protein
MLKYIQMIPRAAAAIAFCIVLAAAGATPASATNGRTAVGMCIDSTASGARCGWAVSDDGSIDICNKNGCITCPSAEGECTVSARVKRTPPGLPAGATVTTKLGAFTVGDSSKQESIDSVILRAKKAKYSR